MSSNKVSSGGTVLRVECCFPKCNGGLPFTVQLLYQNDRYQRLIRKLEQALKRYGVQGLSANAVLEHVIGYSRHPLYLTGLKFHNRTFKGGNQMGDEFLKKERSLAEEILEIIFCEEDSIANNSSPYTLEFVDTKLTFDTKSAFREAVVLYRAADKPKAMVRVTISGLGIDSSSRLEIDFNGAWVSNRYQDFRVRGKFMPPLPCEVLEDACQEEDASSQEEDAPGQDSQVLAVRIPEFFFQHGCTEADEHSRRLLGRSWPDYVVMAKLRGPR